MNIIGVVTSTRAEYGLLYPLLKKIDADDELDLHLMVTGTHLSDQYGNTINEIQDDGFSIKEEIPILVAGNTSCDISLTMANAIEGFAHYFAKNHIDLLIILGDRTEMLGVACAAMNAMIPIAHISGGSVTEGAVDDCVRHCLTKMSYLHFTTTEAYRKRVIQMGEQPEHVINAGSLAVDNIVRLPLLSEERIRTWIGIKKDLKYAVVTFHPITRDNDFGLSQLKELCMAMKKQCNLFYVITGSNADSGGVKAKELLTRFADENDNAVFIESLGKTRYLSAIKYASLVLGNSSSGITEAPILGTPTVNVGDRQKGRLMPDTVINSVAQHEAIIKAIHKALNIERIKTTVYGKGNAATTIANCIKGELKKGINVKKKFYDIDFEEATI